MTELVPSMFKRCFDARIPIRDMAADCKGNAAIEFCVIVPLMLMMFFGMVELSTALAIDRKLTLTARTLSDLTSQVMNVTDTELGNFGQTGKAILTPYAATPLQSTITELYVDPATNKAKVKWSRAATINSSGSVSLGTSSYSVGDIVAIPPALNIADTYLILSEVKYNYKTAVPYFTPTAGLPLSDKAFTRPRQSKCVTYNSAAC